MPRRPLLALLAVLLIGGATSAVIVTRGPDRERAQACGGRAGGEEAEERGQGERGRGERAAPAADLFTGPGEIESPCGEAIGKPESFADLAKANSGIVTKSVAPGTRIRTGAYRAAIGQRAALPVVGTTWKRYGTPPLQSYRTDYDTETGSTREGLGDLSGRATAITRSQGTLYAAISNGGIWKSADDGNSWTSVGEKLPTQVVSGVAVSGERLLVLTGDNAFGGNTYAGLGAYFSDDGGATWKHAAGIPDGLLSFRLAVDPNDEKTVYAATGGGLFRSTDGGRSYTNVNLPTGKDAPAGTPDCTGQPTTAKDCFLANVVTDVVVQAPANEQSSGGKPGAVMAAVGWRAGTKPNADGAQQSPGNGIYVSDDGAPGSFTNADFAGHSTPATDPLTQARIGRIALGGATGADQDHRIVYALVQDAVKFNGGIVGLDANENDTTSAVQSDYLNGVWVSTDFGQSWKQLEGSTVIDNDPTSNSALSPPVCKAPAVISYCPGIQAWYNLWIAPDPSRQTSAGVPTRLAFGLEEVWSNTGPLESPTGLDGTVPEKFGVVGRYYAGETCTLLNATNGLPICPVAQGGQVPAFTTHPDQHGALWVPDASGGGVTLFIGNDGGLYKQHVDQGADLANDQWGQNKPEGHSGANNGLNTLQPYDASMAKDGTVYMGLQDNGEAKIEPDGSMYTIYGGDGFFSAVDPDNSDVAYEEYVAGDISVTRNGGKTWTDIAPSLTSAQFSTPFEMDPANANHLVIGGRNVFETTSGPDTASGTWQQVYDLGTQQHAGDASASASATDPDNQLSAVSTRTFGDGTVGTYVGYCGFCDTITQGTPFANGIATNVGGDWHIAAAKGLPSRYITSARIDDQDPKTVYVTLAGYGRRWAFPGAVGEDTSKVGTGHVFKSTDAGETFTDVTGNLPDTPADWSVVHDGHLVVGTDIGVFESCNTAGGGYSRLGRSLPITPISTIRPKPGDPDTLVVATYGRGVYTYTFKQDHPSCAARSGVCAATSGFKSVKVTPRGRGLRFQVRRAVTAKYGVEVLRQSRGRRVLFKAKVVKAFRNRKGSFTWKGSKHLAAGIYYVRVRVKSGAIFDSRRFTFARAKQRFRGRPTFYATESCTILRSARLNRAAFGGPARRQLAVTVRLRRPATVKVTFAQRGKTLLTRTRKITDRKFHRVVLKAAQARRGDVAVTVRAGQRTKRLIAKRL